METVINLNDVSTSYKKMVFWANITSLVMLVTGLLVGSMGIFVGAVVFYAATLLIRFLSSFSKRSTSRDSIEVPYDEPEIDPTEKSYAHRCNSSEMTNDAFASTK